MFGTGIAGQRTTMGGRLDYGGRTGSIAMPVSSLPAGERQRAAVVEVHAVKEPALERMEASLEGEWSRRGAERSGFERRAGVGR
nr:unnamed protein product [Digitaria exilis]